MKHRREHQGARSKIKTVTRKMTEYHASPYWFNSTPKDVTALALGFTGYARNETGIQKKDMDIKICTLSESPRLDISQKWWDLSPGLRPDRPSRSSQAIDLSHTPFRSAGRPGHSQRSSLYDVRRASCARGHSAPLSKSGRPMWSWNSHSLCCWHVWNGKKVS